MKFFACVFAIFALASGAFAATPVPAAELEAVFQAAVQYVSSSPANEAIDDDTRLEFYSNFKQATVGPCNTEAPGMMQWTARAKWTAWKELGDKSKEEAMQSYIAILTEKVPEWRN